MSTAPQWTAPQASPASMTRIVHAAPRYTTPIWFALALSALVLTAFAVALARAGLVACGINVFGLEMSNCLQPQLATPATDDRLAAALQEAEQLGRTLDQLR